MADSITEQLVRLERRVDTLLSLNTRLREENEMLKTTQEQLVVERASLLEKTGTARVRIEGMISRLKAMEQH